MHSFSFLWAHLDILLEVASVRISSFRDALALHLVRVSSLSLRLALQVQVMDPLFARPCRAVYLLHREARRRDNNKYDPLSRKLLAFTSYC
jgi:hypothetical protein